MKASKSFSFTLICVITYFGLPLTSQAQTQKGADIDGEAAGDASGMTISMPNANTVAIGAGYNDGIGLNAGHVRIYSWNGSAWLQKGNDIEGEAAGDQSGWSVNMPDPNTIAIGTPYNDGIGYMAGHVRIYSWSGSSWIQKGADIDGDTAWDQFGCAVSMPDANTIAIGAEINNIGPNNAPGYVSVYTWNGSSWVQKGIDITGEAATDKSGYAISMPDANTVAIGAFNNDGNGSDAGHVRIHTWNGTSWVQKGSDIDGEAAGDQSGVSVSMPDANTVVIGARFNDGINGSNSGHLRIYSWSGSAWTQKGADIDGEAANDQSGFANMPDANTVAIGASANDGFNGSNSGHVRIYSWNGSAWVQQGVDIDGEAAGDGGTRYPVCMPDANTVSFGATGNDGNGNGAGHVRVYSLCTNSIASITDTACNAYTSPSGIYTWTSSGTYTDTLMNSTNCDSILTINLTITSVDTSVTQTGNLLSANATGATYAWLDCTNNFAPISGATGQTYLALANGSYACAITMSGCTVTSSCHTICNTNSGSLSTSACYTYTSPSGNNTWTTSGTYTDTLMNSSGCDSILTINLTINSVDTSVTQTGYQLAANASGANYAWLDCANNFAAIPGATGQSFIATGNGSYACAIMQNGCTDTTLCYTVSGIGLQELGSGKQFQVFPNPATNVLNVRNNSGEDHFCITLTDVSGHAVFKIDYIDFETLEIDLSTFPSGVYLLSAQTKVHQENVRVTILK